MFQVLSLTYSSILQNIFFGWKYVMKTDYINAPLKNTILDSTQIIQNYFATRTTWSSETC